MPPLTLEGYFVGAAAIMCLVAFAELVGGRPAGDVPAVWTLGALVAVLG